MSELLIALVGIPTLIAMVNFAAPLILASLGGLFCERSGIVNIALEGVMTVGAFFAIVGSVVTGSWVGGLLLAIVAGVAFSALHAVATVTLRADQIITGTALILIAAGLVNFLYATMYGAQGTPSDVSRPANIGGINLLALVAFLAVGVTYFIVFNTPWGLRLRSVGEHPRAADTVGINVYAMRYQAVLISGMLAGLAGAVVSFNVGSYTENMIAGRGFIALAALVFGKWHPVGVLGACLLFGWSLAIETRLGGVDFIPSFVATSGLLSALPYVITLVALAGFVGRSVAPAAVGKPYAKH